MGVTVRQKSKGKGSPWSVFIHVNGKIRSKQVGDRKAAEAVASALRKKLAAGSLHLDDDAEKKTPEFSAYAQHYMDSYAKVALKLNTWKGYDAIIRRHLNPVWRGKRLDEITRADVKSLILQKQQDGFRAGTVENIKALVSGIFTHAYEDEILANNPALKLGRFIPKQDLRGHINPLNREQVASFLATAQQEATQTYAALLCAFRTGLRMGELLGLAWEDVHFDTGTIEVCRAYSHGHFSTPKSHKTRLVDMSDQLKRVLVAHREKSLQRSQGKLPTVTVPEGIKGGTDVHLVFINRDGGPIDGDNLRHRVFYGLLEKADIPRIRFHDIRHTFASQLLQEGAPLHYVKDQMGHASIQTTVDVYGHLMPGANRTTINRLDDPPTQLRLVPAAG